MISRNELCAKILCERDGAKTNEQRIVWALLEDMVKNSSDNYLRDLLQDALSVESRKRTCVNEARRDLRLWSNIIYWIDSLGRRYSNSNDVKDAIVYVDSCPNCGSHNRTCGAGYDERMCVCHSCGYGWARK
jgi:hypothetical protein